MKNGMSGLGKLGAVTLGVALAGGVAMAQMGGGGMGGGAAQQPQQQQTTPGGAAGAGPGAGVDGMNAPGAMGGMNPNQASMMDKDFLQSAAQGGMFEIQAGQLAQQKASAADVKQFGQMMVTDHTKLNQDMMPVAAQAGVKPPKGLSGKEKGELKKLQALNGDAFDQAYIACMVKDHKDDKKAFEAEAMHGQLAAEKQAATQGEAMIDAHLKAAEQLAQAHNVPEKGAM